MSEPLSARNPRLRRLASLARNRRDRADQGAYVVDGPVLVADALTSGVAVEVVYVEGDAPPAVAAAARAAGVDVVRVVDGGLSRAVDVVTPRPVAAVAARRPAALDDVADGAAVLVLVELGDPGNLGTLLRSAEAAGVGAVLCSAGTVDAWSPKVVRASAGSLFRIPVVEGGEAVALLDAVGATGRRRIATRTADARPYDAEGVLDGPVALVMGNEAHGVPPALDAVLDDWVSIPMAGRTESLNVAMAGTVLCFELARRARAAGRAT